MLQEKYGTVNFETFIKYVCDSVEVSTECKRTMSDPRLRGRQTNKCPEVDVHWRPFYTRCHYCEVDYEVIGRVETFTEDVR